MMKPEMITLKHGDSTIKMPASALAKLAIASVFAQVLPPATPAANFAVNDIPALGAYWTGEGGHNGGLVAAHGDVPAHYLIIGAKDIGSLEWGGRGTESKATSKRDGLHNTRLLCGDEDLTYPAADACAEYQADGRHDFYLPACAELYEAWLNVPELFAKDTWYWSSSQRSADSAFLMGFVGGNQDDTGKSNEFRVRPVRRLFI
jgi:hypothetical protein